ncbi:uncharacterized protein [Antedon mediterranea]|uniref:uncharacterized protein isoform X2 n=1 Tax=Antedon mediterranea TaxID=105859 RepID=UPI003AF523AC
MWMFGELLTLIVFLQLGYAQLEPLTLNVPKKTFVVEANDESYVEYLIDVIDELLLSNPNDEGKYVLQSFSEYDVPIPIESNSLIEIQESVRSLDVYDNQNCSTRGIKSLPLYSALNSSASNSLVVVVTGTGVESDGTFIPELFDIIQKKQLRVIFVVSDECSDGYRNGRQLIDEVKEVSSGVIFPLETQNISQIIRFIQIFDYGDDVSLLSPTLSTPGVSAYQLYVDESIEQLIVILSGLEPIISISDVDGKKLEAEQDFEYIVASNKLQIIVLENVFPTEYTLSVFSSTDNLVQVIGFAPSPIDIRFMFYYEKTINMTQASERPYTTEGSQNVILMQVENTETNVWHSHDIIQKVEFISLVGEVLRNIYMDSSNFVKEENADHAHYVMQIRPPDDHFYITVRGVNKNQPFQRSSKVAFSQWRPVPSRPSSFIVFEAEDCDYEAIWYEPVHTFTKSLIAYQFSFGLDTDTPIEFLLPSNVTSYRVNELAKGLTYVFTVAAVNEAGVGESLSVTVITPSDRPIAPPTNIHAIQATDSLIEISWQPPAATMRGGKIIRYTTIHFLMTEPWIRYRFKSRKTRVVFKNLLPNSEYGFQISAHTIMGQGPFSRTSVFRTTAGLSSGLNPVQNTTYNQTNSDIDSVSQGSTEVSVDSQTRLNVTKWNVITHTEAASTDIPDEISTTDTMVESITSQQNIVSDSQSESKLVFEVEVYTETNSPTPSGEILNELDEDITDDVTEKQQPDVVEQQDSLFNNSLARIIAYPVNDQAETEAVNGNGGESFITLERKLEDVTQPVKGRVVFICRIKGSPTVNYSWYLDDELIKERSGRVREKMIPHRGMRLTIRDLTLVDQGKYTCRGENGAGKIETSAVLNVRFGPTGIVTDLQALDVSSNEVTIKWFPPLLDLSDGPLLKYIVYIHTLSLPSETYKFDTNVTELVYKNLEPNTEYVIRVRAVTSKGIGPYSSVSIKTIEDTPVDDTTDKDDDQTTGKNIQNIVTKTPKQPGMNGEVEKTTLKPEITTAESKVHGSDNADKVSVTIDETPATYSTEKHENNNGSDTEEMIPEPEEHANDGEDHYVVPTPEDFQEPEPDRTSTLPTITKLEDETNKQDNIESVNFKSDSTEMNVEEKLKANTNTKDSSEAVSIEEKTDKTDGIDTYNEENPELKTETPFDIEPIEDVGENQETVKSTTVIPNYDGNENEENDDGAIAIVTESIVVNVDTTMKNVELGEDIETATDISVMEGDSQSLSVDTNGDKLTVDETENVIMITDTYIVDADDVNNEDIVNPMDGGEVAVNEVPHLTVAAPLQHRIIDYNGKATLRCFVIGFPLPSYEWYHEGKRIPVVRGRIKDRTFGWGSRIIIKNITESDKGRYTCVAKNVAAERSLEGTVSVRGVAKIDDIQVIIKSSTEALVVWTKPNYIASGATYVVRFYNEVNRGLKYHFSTTRTETYYRQLLPNSAYTFRVKMQRDDRSSVFSKPIMVKTPPLEPTTISPKDSTSSPSIDSTTLFVNDKIVVGVTNADTGEGIQFTTGSLEEFQFSTATKDEKSQSLLVTTAPEFVHEDLEPLTTAVPEPKATAAPEPMVTAAPEPMVTDDPEPMTAVFPEPMATATHGQVVTDDHEPMATAAPEPMATKVPDTVVTDDNEPMVTAAREPISTSAPKPISTAVPEPEMELMVTDEKSIANASPELVIDDTDYTTTNIPKGTEEPEKANAMESTTSSIMITDTKNSPLNTNPPEDTTSTDPVASQVDENEESQTSGPIANDGTYLRLIRPLPDVIAFVDDRLNLRCTVDANPSATLLWHKDGNPLNIGGDKIKERKYLKGSILTFKEIKMSDAGRYTCIALNHGNVVETSGNITVIPKGRITQKPVVENSHTVMKRSVRPGSNKDVDPSSSYASSYTTHLPSLVEEVFITPDAETPKVTRVSQHDPQMQKPDGSVVVRVTGIEPEEVFQDAKTDRLGNLNARPSQTWDSSRSGEPYVEIKKYMEEQSVEVGDRVVFLCRIIGEPKPRFLWYKDGAPLVFDDSRMKERVLDTGSRFTIKQALLRDAGIYTCYGLNDYQTVSMRATLEVFNPYVNPYQQPSTTPTRTKPNTKPRTKPPAKTTLPITYKPTDPFTTQVTNSYTKKHDCIGEISKLCMSNELVGKKVDIDDRISLRCQIYGDPQPEYRWYKNGIRIYPTKLGLIREKAFPWGSRLAFRGVREADTGEYRCQAINAAGIKETKAWLLVGPYATIPPQIETEAPTTTVEAYRPTTTQTKPKPPKKTPRPTAPRPPKKTTQRVDPTDVFLPTSTSRPSVQKCISGDNGELCYASMPHQVGVTGGSVVFQCRMSGTPEPQFIWFKNGVLIFMDEEAGEDDMQRIRIKQMSWGSRLVIKDIVHEDAGTYLCVGAVVDISEIVQAELSVVEGSQSKPPPKKKPNKNKPPKTPNTPKPKPQRPRTPTTGEDTTPPVYRPRPETGNNGGQPEGSPDGGRCVVYTGSVCRRYLKSQMVYVDGGSDLYSIDYQLQATLQTLSATDLQCMSYLEPFLCFKAFPLCDDSGKSKSICQEDCSVLTRSYCRDLTDLKVAYPGQYLWMPAYDDCSTLPSVNVDSQCITVGLTNSNTNRSPTAGSKPAGKCRPYNSDGICSEYVGNRNTFIKSGLTLAKIETNVMSIFTAVLTLGSVSRQCSNYLLPYICLRALPPCNRNDRPLEVCREDCEVLSNNICYEEFRATLATDELDNSVFKLNDCLSLPSQSGKYSCTTLSISSEFRATETDVVFPTSPQPTRNCEAYKGTVCSKYLSGRKIYLNSGQKQSEIENEIIKIKELLDTEMDSNCGGYLFKEICLTMLPVCNSRAKKREICREECSQLHNEYCYNDYQTLQVLLRGRDDVLTDCSTLPWTSDIRGPTCIELGVSSLPEVAPQVEVELEMDSSARQTSTVTLRCRVTGSPPPTIEWSKDGEILQSTNNISLDRNKVRIQVTSEREEGTYTCTAKNSAGIDKQNMLINLV